MQTLYRCVLRHKGGQTMQLPLDKVTAAEIHLLRRLHGQDAVIKIVEIGARDVSDYDELQRLRKKYHLSREGDDRKTLTVDAMWPGETPVLPSKIKPIKRDRVQAGPVDETPAVNYEKVETFLDKPIPLDGREFEGEDEGEGDELDAYTPPPTDVDDLIPSGETDDDDDKLT